MRHDKFVDDNESAKKIRTLDDWKSKTDNKAVKKPVAQEAKSKFFIWEAFNVFYRRSKRRKKG